MADTDGATEANLSKSEEGLTKEAADTPADTAAAVDDSAGEQLTSTQALLLITAVGLSTFIAALEQTIISTASPTISRSFHSSELDFTWIGTAYLLPAAAAVPRWGKMSDIFGRKPILTVNIIVFWIGSLIGALSINTKMLIAARAIQGIGGGGILGLSATIIADVFSPRERSKYFGVLGVVWGMACGLGPIIGGAFCQYVTWRWCFWINLPVAGVAGVLCVLFLKVHTPRTPIWEGFKAMDWLGTILVVGATVMFLLGLGYGGVAYPWKSAIVICLIVFGIVTFAVYALVEWKVAKYPITPLRLFKSTSNIATFGVAYMHGAVYMANFYYLPLYFQAVLGATPVLSGVYLLPVAVTLCVASTLTGVYISKTGRYRPPIYFGLIMMILGDGLYINLQPYASWPRIIIFQIIAGVGLGPLFQAPIIAVFSLTKAADIASSAATVLFMRDIATAMSIVFGGVIFENRIDAHASEINAAVPGSLAAQITGGDATSVTDEIRALPADARAVVANVYTEALMDEWIFYTALSAAALVLSLLISKQVLSREHKINKQGLDVQEASRLEELEKSNGGKTETSVA
ncbi:major facilitator superfamily-domain-containing protein [Lipomyces kononenkoae]|uniref:Major facilitator superfamily-domain-containing protein n=1 Tax=Lipomyces kononenkoae TaxID=34357 RepID=A0ACC3SSK1_LIPKO